VKISRRILSYLFLVPIFLLISIALTVIKTCSVMFFDLCIGRINPGTFGAGLTSHCSGLSGSSMVLSSSMLDTLSTYQSSSLWFGLSKSPFQSSQFSVPKCFQVDNHHHVQLHGGRLNWFGGHLSLEKILTGGHLQTKLIVKVIFWQCKCSQTIRLKVLPGCFDDLFSIWHVSYNCQLLVLTEIPSV